MVDAGAPSLRVGSPSPVTTERFQSNLAKFEAAPKYEMDLAIKNTFFTEKKPGDEDAEKAHSDPSSDASSHCSSVSSLDLRGSPFDFEQPEQVDGSSASSSRPDDKKKSKKSKGKHTHKPAKLPALSSGGRLPTAGLVDEGVEFANDGNEDKLNKKAARLLARAQGYNKGTEFSHWTARLPSIGTLQHALGNCKPCPKFIQCEGCEKGMDCQFCHARVHLKQQL